MTRYAALCGFYLILAFLTGVRPGWAQDAPAYPDPLFTGPTHELPYSPYDIEHLRLAVRLELQTGKVFGVATYRLRLVEDSVPALALHVGPLEVFGARAGVLDDDKVTASYWLSGSDSLMVDLDSLAGVREPLEVQITYAATPSQGLYLYRPPGSRQPTTIWTDAAPESHRHWLPMPFSPSDLLTSEILISVPTDMEALANGALTETMPTEDGLMLFHYVQDQQHAPYAIGFVAGRFFKYEQAVQLSNGYEVPFAQWVPAERTDEVARTFQETASILNYFSTRSGIVYPWPRYTQVLAGDLTIDQLDFTGYTLLNDRFLLDDRAALDENPTHALASAIAHQWVGAMLPADFWSESWIARGLSTYLGLLYVREREGDEAFYLGLHRLAEAYFEEATRYRRPLVWNTWDHPYQLTDRHQSARAAWVFHTLHETLGDASFWDFLESFHRARAFTPVNSDQLMRAITTWSKTSFDRYFDQWVYSAGHPDVEVTYRYDAMAESLYVEIDQKQEGYLVPASFDMSLALEVYSLGSSQRVTVNVDEARERAVFPVALAPRFVVVDPDHRYLMQARVRQDLTAWVAQLRYAPNVLDRLAAVDALALWQNDPALGIGLQPVLQSQPTGAVYAAMVRLLATMPPSESTDRWLMEAFDRGDPVVKRLVLEGLAGRENPADLTIMAMETAETARSYTLQAAAVATLAAIGAPSAQDIVRSALITPSHREQVRLAGLAAVPVVGIPTREGVQLATAHAGAQHPAEVRIGAVRLLAYYAGLGNKSAATALAGLTSDAAPLVAAAARAATAMLSNPDGPTADPLNLDHLRKQVRPTN